MAEEKDMKTAEAPEGAEAAETAETQVAETDSSEQAETPVSPEPVEAAEADVEDAPVAEATPAAKSAEAPAPERAEARKQSKAAPVADETAAESGEEAVPEDDAAAHEGTSAARRARRVGVSVGIAHIRATFNNTMVSISDMRGGVISWSSAGRAGFKGSRKSTAFAATMVGQDAARQAVAKGMHEVEVHVQGAGSGRESAIRALQTSGLVVTLIKDVTPMPHNGCRQRKRRRV